MRNPYLAAAFSILAAQICPNRAGAQEYPVRPIEIVVPFAPGGVTDVLGRALAQGLPNHLSQRTLVTNKPGASGAVGAAAVARSTADGHMLLFTGAPTMLPYPALSGQTGYDRTSFEPICQAYKFDLVIIVRPDSPYKSMADLVAAAKARPGAITYGHLGAGSSFHLTMISLSQAANVTFNPIPFRGDSETMQQVLGGQVDFGIVTLSAAAGGGHRMLGTFAQARNAAFPDVPTMVEQGLPVTGSSAMSIGGLFAPAGVPAEVKRKLADACAAAAQGADYTRIAKGVHQPHDYFAGSTDFAGRVDEAVAVKARLLMALEPAK